ncbi:50S ribosomal protein L5 [bacterium]|nr:50S ribosomal protein L5 [bacterium]
MEPRLKTKYKEVRKKLKKEFKYKNEMQIPNIKKIVVNMGVGDAIKDYKNIEAAMKDLSIITGQKPRINKARKSIANFKLRDGMAVGTSVTLRRAMMWEFLDRFISVTAPRIKDFKGFKTSQFDGRGNYNFGLREQFIFPEIDIEKVQVIRGMNISITTSNATDEEAEALLRELGFPFKKQKK